MYLTAQNSDVPAFPERGPNFRRRAEELPPTTTRYVHGNSSHSVLLHLDVGALVETVHLIQQLQQDALHLAVGPRLCVEALGRDGVDLVDKHH